MKGTKRLIATLGGVALAFSSLVGQVLAAPADQTATVNVTATVNNVFTLTLNTSTVTFTGGPGDTPTPSPTTVIATVKSNFTAGSPWQLKIKKNQDLTDSDITNPTPSIPSASFTHTSTGGAGTHADSVDTVFSTTSTIYYTATTPEKNNLTAGTAITSPYKLVIPTTQSAGTYTNTTTHTLVSP